MARTRTRGQRPEKFSDWLTDRMLDWRATGKELAELTGIDSASISRFRSGEREPTDDQRWQLEHALLSPDANRAERHRAQLALDRIRGRRLLPMAGESAAHAPQVTITPADTRDRVVV